jgi:hypothetical protein
MNAWLLGLVAGLICSFGITMFIGSAGSEWFKEEVSLSLKSIHGLDGLQSSTTQAGISGHTKPIKSNTAKLNSLSAARVSKKLSSKQKLEETDEASTPSSGEVPSENEPTQDLPEEVEDCAIKLANGNVPRTVTFRFHCGRGH